jgi:hypothetical protein
MYGERSGINAKRRGKFTRDLFATLARGAAMVLPRICMPGMGRTCAMAYIAHLSDEC